ncbi:MAG: nucleotidyltransferase domain-containing protein [Candidatus Omnitrophica bacterium]|nr:nucleotidyltransferase domain-containing protein [Candidatus Omnitrophota bacterium]MBU1128303.1 nucleotidyltransferase domain-containing protein [Candidatus Omnitrophota bacterium]MBU1657105.1 nucleotidyltransferase domain-containing protein [Candidatus Omnitrophota bacterium]
MNIDYKNSLYHFTPLKILSFLSSRAAETFSAKEISKLTASSKGATNQALRLLAEMDIITREKKGNLFLYESNFNNIILKQFKIFEVLMATRKLIKHIRPYCYKIVLFGSCASGSNDTNSDIDLFITTDKRDSVQKHVSKFNRSLPYVNAAMYDPLEILASEKKDKAFFEQIKKGITLWEGRPTSEKF